MPLIGGASPQPNSHGRDPHTTLQPGRHHLVAAHSPAQSGHGVLGFLDLLHCG